AQIVTASDDGTAWIWDANSGIPLVALLGHENSVRSAAFSRDGTHIVTASWDKSIRIWNAGSQEVLALFRGNFEDPTHPFWNATFSPDGNRVMTVADDHTVRFWDLRPNEPLIAVLKGNEWSVNSARFSPDQARLATPSGPTTRVWEVGTAK